MDDDLEGIGKLRIGALYLALAELVIMIILSPLMPSPIQKTILHLYTSVFQQPSSIADVKIIVEIVFLSVISPAIMGYFYMMSGFKILAVLDRISWKGFLAVKNLFLALFLLVISGIFLTSIFLFVKDHQEYSTNPFLIAGLGISSLIGLAGIIIQLSGTYALGKALTEVGEKYREGVSKAGGRIIRASTILSFFIPIVTYAYAFSSQREQDLRFLLIVPYLFLLGFILVYLGLRRVHGPPPQQVQPKQQARQPVTQQTPFALQTQPVPQIYQVGQGTIRGNGIADISLYSNVQAVVLSARIEGTTFASANQVVLQPGTNSFSIKFNNIPQLVPGNTYLITLVINVGGNIMELKATAVYQPGLTAMQIYQVEQGIIRGDGTATIILYSAVEASTISAKIEGTMIKSYEINPATLIRGQNVVTIKFDSISSLVPNSVYLITLLISENGKMSEVKATAVYRP